MTGITIKPVHLDMTNIQTVNHYNVGKNGVIYGSTINNSTIARLSVTPFPEPASSNIHNKFSLVTIIHDVPVVNGVTADIPILIDDIPILTGKSYAGAVVRGDNMYLLPLDSTSEIAKLTFSSMAPYTLTTITLIPLSNTAQLELTNGIRNAIVLDNGLIVSNQHQALWIFDTSTETASLVAAPDVAKTMAICSTYNYTFSLAVVSGVLYIQRMDNADLSIMARTIVSEFTSNDYVTDMIMYDGNMIYFTSNLGVAKLTYSNDIITWISRSDTASVISIPDGKLLITLTNGVLKDDIGDIITSMPNAAIVFDTTTNAINSIISLPAETNVLMPPVLGLNGKVYYGWNTSIYSNVVELDLTTQLSTVIPVTLPVPNMAVSRYKLAMDGYIYGATTLQTGPTRINPYPVGVEDSSLVTGYYVNRFNLLESEDILTSNIILD